MAELEKFLTPLRFNDLNGWQLEFIKVRKQKLQELPDARNFIWYKKFIHSVSLIVINVAFIVPSAD